MYYALFHLLVEDAARRFMPGSNRTHLRHCLQRAFTHSTMKTVARQFASGGVSPRLEPGLSGHPLQPELTSVADTFVTLQEHRHEADYDLARRFTRGEALGLVADTQRAFSEWSTIRNSVQADTFLTGLLVFDSIAPRPQWPRRQGSRATSRAVA